MKAGLGWLCESFVDMHVDDIVYLPGVKENFPGTWKMAVGVLGISNIFHLVTYARLVPRTQKLLFFPPLSLDILSRFWFC